MSCLRHCELSELLVSDGFLWSIEWSERPSTCGLYQQCPNTSACPSVSPSFSVCSLVPCYSNFSYWYDWYETRRNTLYKTICSVSLSTGSCQYNGGMWIITPIFLYFVNFCICLSAMGWPFFVLSKWRKLVMRNCSVTYIALVEFCIRVKDFNLKSYSKIHSVFYYLK